MDEIEKDRTMKLSVMQMWKDFGKKTTMHGLGRAFGSRRQWKCVVWSLLVLFFAGWAVYQLTQVIQDFYTYPVTTLVALKHDSVMRFPAVTVCNINKVKASSTPELVKRALQNLMKDSYDNKRILIDYAVRYLRSENRSSTEHHMSDMLISCSYNGNPCSADNFTELVTGRNGLCHTFAASDLDDRFIGKPGPMHGLTIEMTVEHSEYMSITPLVCVIVLIHKHDELPFPQDGGILVQPGMSTNVAVKKTETHRLPPPYGECVSQKDTSSRKLTLFDDEKYRYTENACLKSCYQIYLFHHCKCCDINLPCDSEKIFKILEIKSEEEPLVPYCNSTSSPDSICAFDLEMKFFNGELNCSNKCPPPCDQTTFDMVLSTALWPSDPYFEVLMHNANNTVLKNTTFDSPDDLRKYISKNFLRFNVNYESFDFIEVFTKPVYHWSNLLGDIGGQLGLYLGFSILTALEILELCLDTLVVCARRMQSRNIVRKHDKCDSNV